MRISDWSSDVCSSDLNADDYFLASHRAPTWLVAVSVLSTEQSTATFLGVPDNSFRGNYTYLTSVIGALIGAWLVAAILMPRFYRSEEHTSELQSLMRNSYAVFCLKKKTYTIYTKQT